MQRLGRSIPLLAAMLLAASPARAQLVDPSGHWEGSIQVQGTDLILEVDLAKNARGEFGGTLSMPGQSVRGLPLKSVIVDGSWVTFSARTDQVFKAIMQANGQSMAGDFAVAAGSVPFGLDRKGNARFEPAARNAAIGKAFEGVWEGVLSVDGASTRVVLTLSNLADGTSVGSLSNLDQGGVTIPLTSITQTAAGLSLQSRVVAAALTGTLGASGELVGTYTQGTLSAPITFRRAAAEAR